MIPDAKEKCSILHLPRDPALHSSRLGCSKKTLLLCNQQSSVRDETHNLKINDVISCLSELLYGDR